MGHVDLYVGCEETVDQAVCTSERDADFIASVRDDAPRAYALIRQLGEALLDSAPDQQLPSARRAAMTAYREAIEEDWT